MLKLPHAHVFRQLPRDGWLLFGTRSARLFAYGLFSVVLVLYLDSLGFSEGQIGLLLTLTLLGDTAISLWLTTTADWLGRRKMLLVGAFLMIFAGVVFAWSANFWLLLLAATVGVISPSGNEVGPFLSIEQAALSETVPAGERTSIFAWYNLAGSLATAAGALCGGGLTQLVQNGGLSGAASYRPLAFVYAAIGAILAIMFAGVSPVVETSAKVEPDPTQAAPARRFGLHRSRPVVFKLSALFALDAFGGGFVLQSIVAYWFHVRFESDPVELGAIFFAANLLAGASALAAASLARRFGLVNTMVFTHLPSNILLLMVPLMPTAWLAVLVLLLRFSISQMDVPTRQSYTMAVVSPDERSAAAGITGVARSIGGALSPFLAGELLAGAFLAAPFILAGGIKIVYDLILYRSFVRLKGAEHASQ